MTEPKTPLSLKELDAKLRAARGGDRPDGGAGGGGGADTRTSAIGIAARVGVELVAALIVGIGIGYLLDAWLDTKPWLMMVFLVLGAATGIVNVWRALSGMSAAVGYSDTTKTGAPPQADRNGSPGDRQG
jgi:ATP synthase protein I